MDTKELEDIANDNEALMSVIRGLKISLANSEREKKVFQKELDRMRGEALIAKINKLDEEIEKYKHLLNNHIHRNCEAAWMLDYLATALEEKIERLELEKAKLRTEG